MQTRNLGIVLDQGADFKLVILLSDSNGPIDITGYAFKSEMRLSTDPTSPIVAEFDFAILNQTTNKGQVVWTLDIADSESVTTSIANALKDARQTTPFVFDVKMKDTLDQVTRIIQGLIFVSPQATQEEFT